MLAFSNFEPKMVKMAQVKKLAHIFLSLFGFFVPLSLLLRPPLLFCIYLCQVAYYRKFWFVASSMTGFVWYLSPVSFSSPLLTPTGTHKARWVAATYPLMGQGRP